MLRNLLLSVVLFLLALVCAIIAVLIVTVWQWPLWSSVCFFILLYSGILLLFYFLTRSKTPSAQSLAEKLRLQFEQANIHFKKSTPWVLLLGDENSGKTASLTCANLISSKHSPTESCDFWPLAHCIVADPSAKLLAVGKNHHYLPEWHELVSLITHRHAVSPLSAIVLVFSVAQLQTRKENELQEYAHLLRQRWEDLSHSLASPPPMYLMLSQCEHIHGFNVLHEKLPLELKHQAMGYASPSEQTTPKETVERTFQSIEQALRRLRWQLAKEDTSFDTRLLLLSHALQQLKTPCQIFLNALLDSQGKSNPPRLRGIYFSANEYRHPNASLASKPKKEALFIADFFNQILPREQFATPCQGPNKKQIQRRKLTGYGLWLALCLCLAVTLGHHYHQQVKQLNQIKNQLAELNRLKPNTLQDAIFRAGEYYQLAERINSLSTLSTFPSKKRFTQLRTLLQQTMVSHVTDDVIPKLDTTIFKQLHQHAATIPASMIGRYTQHLIRRINLLQARLQNQTESKLQTYPIPELSVLNVSVDQPIIESLFNDIYLHALLWSSETSPLYEEKIKLQNWLIQFKLVDNNLHWLVHWADNQAAVPAVTLHDFWLGTQKISRAPRVNAAYTRRGKKAIVEFQHEIESALTDQSDYARHLPGFWIWYQQKQLAAWQHFADNFHQGEKTLANRNEWQQQANVMATHEGPYYRLMNQLDLALHSPSDTDKKSTLSFYLDNLKNNLNLNQEDPFPQAFSAYQQSLNSMNQLNLTTPLEAYKATRDFYLDKKTSPFIQAKLALNQMTHHFQSTDTNDAVLFWNLMTGPLDFYLDFATHETACYLQTVWQMNISAKVIGIKQNQLIPLLFGKQGIVWQFVHSQASPFLELTDQQYHARKALDHSIPFEPVFFTLINTGLKYKAHETTHGSAHDSENELKFISSSPITIETLPTNVNPEATLKPISTTLSVRCAQKTYQLVNYNFPAEITLDWSYQACSTARLAIDFEGFKLTKTYSGKQGFNHFLLDFKNGQVTLNADEFPSQQTLLDAYHLKQITLHYQFTGLTPIISKLEKMEQIKNLLIEQRNTYLKDGFLPVQITQCSLSQP